MQVQSNIDVLAYLTKSDMPQLKVGQRLPVHVVNMSSAREGTIMIGGQEVKAQLDTATRPGDRFWVSVRELNETGLILARGQAIIEDMPEISSRQLLMLLSRGVALDAEIAGILDKFQNNPLQLLAALQSILGSTQNSELEAVLAQLLKAVPQWETLSAANMLRYFNLLGMKYENQLLQQFFEDGRGSNKAANEGQESGGGRNESAKLDESGRGSNTAERAAKGDSFSEQMSAGRASGRGEPSSSAPQPNTQGTPPPASQQPAAEQAPQAQGSQAQQGQQTPAQTAQGQQAPAQAESANPNPTSQNQSQSPAGAQQELPGAANTSQNAAALRTSAEQVLLSNAGQPPGGTQAAQIASESEILKVQLIKLLETAGRELARGERELVQNLLNHITAQQLWLQTGVRKNAFVLIHLPLQDQEELHEARIAIESARKGNKMDANHCRIAIKVDTAHLGPVGADIWIFNDSINLSLLCEDPEGLAELIQEVLTSTQEHFQALGWFLTSVSTKKFSDVPHFEKFLAGEQQMEVNIVG